MKPQPLTSTKGSACKSKQIQKMESDLHQKIVLHQDVVIQDTNQSNIEGLNQEGLLLLKIRNDIVTITPVMKEILNAARSPSTPEELMQSMAQSWGCSYASIYEPVWSFLKRMGKLGALVYAANPSEIRLPILEELSQSGNFAGFVLLERISKNYKVALYKCALKTNDSSFYTLKVLLKRNPDVSLQQKFYKEFEILKALPKHSNIRNCFYAAEHKDISYLLFEYIDGVSLKKKIDKIYLDDKNKIAIQLMDSINHLHRHHILHGDIHASNFLVDQEGNLHLIDLGMAHYEDEDEKHHGGIPRYMPPERMPDHPFDFSSKKGDYRSEVFQIGVCLYFLFSGQYPFRGLLLKNLADAIKYESPPPLLKTPLGEKIPKLLTHVISKAMEKDPMHRYSCVADLMDAWEQAVHHYESILM